MVTDETRIIVRNVRNWAVLVLVSLLAWFGKNLYDDASAAKLKLIRQEAEISYIREELSSIRATLTRIENKLWRQE